jgi:acyl carrier protein
MQTASLDSAAPAARSGAEIELWLRGYLATLLGIDLAKVDTTTTFDRYGLDSAAAIAMVGDLAGC